MCFLSHLAVEERFAASAQNPGSSALPFLFHHALRRDLNVAGSVRAPERAQDALPAAGWPGQVLIGAETPRQAAKRRT